MSDQPLGLDVSKRAARKLARAQKAAQTAAIAPEVTSGASGARRRIQRTIKIVILIVLINYLGLPALAQVREKVHKLGDVSFGWLALGVALEFGALLAYTQLTRVALPRKSIRLFRLFRIQLATKSLNSVVPGGSAAGAALGYRLLVTSGIDGADAGFALAATGLISAVVLNLVFWIALLVSMPFYGFQPGYIVAALFGIFLIVFAGGLALALIRGEAGAERFLRRATRRFKKIEPERVTAIVQQVAGRVREILNEPELARGAAIWAAMNWLLDAGSLFVFIRAFGIIANPIGLLVAYGLVNVLAVIPLTPGGLGWFETVLGALLVGFGVAKSVATVAVVSYRIAAFWLPIPIGAIAYLTVRNDLRLRGLTHAARAAYEQPDSRFDWAEEFGHRPAEIPLPDTDGNGAAEPN